MHARVIRCTLSGSYRKDYEGLLSSYHELVAYGCQVLSPHRMDFTDTTTTFVKDSAERNLSEETIERHHLLAIAQSDFLWLHAPEGYIGTSASFELGFALAQNIPVYASDRPQEAFLAPFIQIVPSVYRAISELHVKVQP